MTGADDERRRLREQIQLASEYLQNSALIAACPLYALPVETAIYHMRQRLKEIGDE